MRRAIFDAPNPRIPIWASDQAVLALWAIAAPMALIAPKALQILVWLLPLASLAALARRGTALRAPWLRPIHAILAIPLAALLCAPISVDPLESAVRALRLAAEFTALCLLITSSAALPRDLRRSAMTAAAVGVAATAAVILLDLATRGAVLTPFWGPATDWEWRRIGYNRGETTLAMLAPTIGFWALSGLDDGRRTLRLLGGAALLLLCAAAIALGASNSAKTALAAGLLLFGTVYALPGLLRPFLWTLALLAFAMPWLIDAVPPRPLIEKTSASLQSIVHRTYIWDFAIARIKERPVLGWGLDASRRMPGGGGEVAVTGFNKAAGVSGGQGQFTGEIMPLHPHNGALQIWLELGGLGALIAAGLIGFAAERLARARPSRIAAAATAAAAAAGFSVALVSYGLWQGWWLAALFLMAALPALMRED